MQSRGLVDPDQTGKKPTGKITRGAMIDNNEIFILFIRPSYFFASFYKKNCTEIFHKSLVILYPQVKKGRIKRKTNSNIYNSDISTLLMTIIVIHNR